MKSCAIVGFGKFGQLLASILKDDFEIQVVTSSDEKKLLARSSGYNPIEKHQLKNSDYIFVTPPISAFEGVIKNIAPHLGKDNVVMDACSVKAHPARVMRERLAHTQSIATHPLFGPESITDGLEGLRIMLSNINANQENYDFWKRHWMDKGLNVIESSPEEHDQETIYTQGMAFLLAHLLGDVGAKPKTFLTENYTMLEEVEKNLLADTDQLFIDLLAYNPEFHKFKSELELALAKLKENLEKAEVKSRDIYK
jgi:prephenate dehydrogenase